MMSAMLSSVFILFAAFAVDLGMQRVVRRDMQAMADVIALDMARQLDGVHTTQQLTNSTAWINAKAESIARNQTNLGATPVVTVTPGKLDGNFDFVPTAAGEIPTAVQVAAGGEVGFQFKAGKKGGATRYAVATGGDSACFGVGSYAVRLATADSLLLNTILGDALGTTVLGYNGLADAKVSLLTLTAALTAASPSGVLDPTQVKLGDFVLAAATALTNTPGSDTADVGLLQSIYAQLDLPNQLIDLGDLVDVGTGNMSAIDSTVNVLDLVYGAAIIANGNNFLAVPNLGINLPNVTNLQSRLHVIEAPQLACDDGVASTSQISIEITGQVDVNLLVARVAGDIGITINLANASASLSDVHCNNLVADQASLTVTNQNLASTTIDFSDLRVTALLLNVPLLGLNVSTTQPSPAGTYNLALPTYYQPNMFRTPQGTQTLPGVTTNQLSLLGINLAGTILTPLLNTVLNPIINQVNTLVTDVTNPILGLNLAGADLTVIPEATCGKPSLVG